MDSSAIAHLDDKESMVDPFLVEAIQNPRHRLTILRMELDIQRFLDNQDQMQFEFQHFPTSYLRLAAHRTAQHYGMQTMVQDTGLDGPGNKILVMKTAESKYPAVRLSDIPAKQTESDQPERVKIAIRRRPNGASGSDGSDDATKRGFLRSVEERKEEYDKARARIFNSPGSPKTDDTWSQVPADEKNICLSRDDNEFCRNNVIDLEKSFASRDGGTSSRVAIFRDREKDRTDPDYDRSYDRYVRSIPANQSCNFVPFNMHTVPFVQYDTGFSQLGQIPRTQSSIGYRPPSNPVMGPFSAGALTQTSAGAAYMQWPSATMMYAHSYDQFRHGVFQAPFCQQPLSFNYSQNH